MKIVVVRKSIQCEFESHSGYMHLEKGDSVIIKGNNGYEVAGIIQYILEDGTISAKTGKGYPTFSGEREKYGHYEVAKVLRHHSSKGRMHL